ncbi:MAG TPA: chromosomal replication initiator protein DnaA [Thermomicrobiales bacterium]|nr:chromosomal replication initiator protein DnaA [Thermomicrobiales bacterium]
MDARRLWQTFLEDVGARLSKSVVDNYLRQSTLVGFDDDVATVAAPNTFTASTLETRFAGPIERCLSAVVGRPVRVEFVVQAAPAAARSRDEARSDTAALLAAGSTVRPARGTATRSTSATASRGSSDPAPTGARVPPPRQMQLAPSAARGLNPRYIYDTYVVGSSNRFAHAASLAVAEHPGGKYNPFFVHGGVGLGKTHLLHAIGHRALEALPDLQVSYVTSEKFTNDLISAIRQQRMDDFRARYREIDILMIDDIQFIAGKESTQEEFFHTFNHLYQGGKQVIITSDKPPKAIAALEERLRSRFEGGLIADVQLPDYEMRTAILRQKGEELGVSLPSDVVEYVAQKDQSNIRELEGAMNKVIARAQLAEQAITLALAMEALTDAASFGARRAPASRAAVLDAVVRHYKAPLRDLLGRARTKDIVLPRQVAMYLLREETGASLVEIGLELGGRDHTTVLHGIRQIERALSTDNALRSDLLSIREAIFSAAAN